MDDADILLYVGGDASTRPLTGHRMFSTGYAMRSRFEASEVPRITGMLDSGAFSDPLDERLDPEQSLERQLQWERNANRLWKCQPGTYVSEALVSYDLLIDEKWTGRHRKKQRWSVAEADSAVQVTVDAARYLSSQRERIAPRKLVLACQGVDDVQYAECLGGVLDHARDNDIVGLGGWCILGLWRSWLPVFVKAMARCLPMIAARGIRRVHIFGVMWTKALGCLLWMADQHGLKVSTDSSAPILRATWKDQKKAGALADTWQENVRLCRERLANLRQTAWYRQPIVSWSFFDEVSP